MEAGNRALLLEGLGALGLVVPPEAPARLERHLALALEWNQRFNLTRISDEREAVLKHIVDSATCWWAVAPRAGMRVLDVGSGAGYPGLVLKVLAPAVEMVLLEATQKKCRFLEHVRDELALPGLTVLCARAEEAGRRPPHREAFDLVVARAVAELRVLLEITLPFVRVGGRMVAMKGPGGIEEAAGVTTALGKLGGGSLRVEEVSLPEDAGERTLIVVEKVAPTPAQYPRQAGLPERRPL